MTMISSITRNGRLVKGDVGIEVEIEGKNLFPVANPLWKSEDDGSLRGVFPESRIEFVLKNPLPHAKAKAAITALFAELNKEGALFNFSFRTSTHVHVNVTDLNSVELTSLIYTYFLLEEPLINFCGKSRKANRFCLRLFDAEGMLAIIKRMLKDNFENVGLISEADIRYAALNLAAVYKYGSVEFRGMRGTSEVDVLHKWVDMLMCLKTFAKGKTPVDIKNMYEELGSLGFLKAVMGGLEKDLLYKDIEKGMAMSRSISLDIPYTWERFCVVKEEPSKASTTIFEGIAYQNIDMDELVRRDVGGFIQPKPVNRRGGLAPLFAGHNHVVMEAIKDEEPI